MRGRSGTVSSRLDPLGRRGVTKRFANPARSRATRGRENAWLEARSPLPLGRRGRPSKTTTTTRSSRLAYRGDRFSPFLRPAFSPEPIFRTEPNFQTETFVGDDRWRRRSRRRPPSRRRCGGYRCRDRRGIEARYGTGQPQTDNVHALPPPSLPPRLRLLGPVDAHPPRAHTSFRKYHARCDHPNLRSIGVAKPKRRYARDGAVARQFGRFGSGSIRGGRGEGEGEGRRRRRRGGRRGNRFTQGEIRWAVAAFRAEAGAAGATG